MTELAVLLAQLASPAAAVQPPDIEIQARVRAERVEVEQQGEAKIKLRVEPGETEPVQVERSARVGQRSYRDLTIDLRAAARITVPAATVAAVTTDKPSGDPE